MSKSDTVKEQKERAASKGDSELENAEIVELKAKFRKSDTKLSWHDYKHAAALKKKK